MLLPAGYLLQKIGGEPVTPSTEDEDDGEGPGRDEDEGADGKQCARQLLPTVSTFEPSR